MLNLLTTRRYCLEVRDWARRAYADGFEPPKETLDALNSLVVNLRSFSLWNSIYELAPFAGPLLGTAKLKLKWLTEDRVTTTNIVEADYIQRGPFAGIRGNGSTKHIDMQCRPDQLPLFHSFGGAFTALSSVTKTLCGSAGAGKSDYKLLFVAVPKVLAYCGDTVVTPGYDLSAEVKSALFCASRSAYTEQSLFIHDKLYDQETANSINITNAFSHYILAQNNNGVAVDHVPFGVQFYFLADPFTSSTWPVFSNIVLAFLNRLGRHHQAA